MASGLIFLGSPSSHNASGTSNWKCLPLPGLIFLLGRSYIYPSDVLRPPSLSRLCNPSTSTLPGLYLSAEHTCPRMGAGYICYLLSFNRQCISGPACFVFRLLHVHREFGIRPFKFRRLHPFMKLYQLKLRLMNRLVQLSKLNKQLWVNNRIKCNFWTYMGWLQGGTLEKKLELDPPKQELNINLQQGYSGTSRARATQRLSCQNRSSILHELFKGQLNLCLELEQLLWVLLPLMAF